MQRSNQHSRVNLVELKTQMIKRIGADKTKLYFYYLNKFLNLKLSKVEFNKLCFRVLGGDNIPLHNQLICSILKNACIAKSAPPLSIDKEVPTSASDGSFIFANEKADFASHQSCIRHDNVALEDGMQKLVRHHQVLMGVDREEDDLFTHSTKLPREKLSADGLVSVQSKKQSVVPTVEDKKEVSARSSLVAPLGIRFCNASTGGAIKPLSIASHCRCSSSYGTGGLLDLPLLRERMQQIAVSQGLEGASMDSVNLLSSGLDAYLKRLINNCFELVATTHGGDLITGNSHKHNSHGKLVNGFLTGHHMPLENSNKQLDGKQEHRSHFTVSLLDFKITMGLNPQQLGEDWPLLLEKIMHAFDE